MQTIWGRLVRAAKRRVLAWASLPPGGRYRCVEADGFRMYVDILDRIVGAALVAGNYEPHVRATLRDAVRPGHTVVDLGANMGYFSLMAASLVGNQGRVIAFEPRDDNVALLCLSARENGFDHLEIHPLAVAEREQAFQYYPGPDNSLSHVVEATRQMGLGTPRMVRAVALDEFLADLPRLDVIKSDIDGNEPRAFQGMRRLLRRHRPVLLFEFAPAAIANVSRTPPQALLEEVYGLGYDLYVLSPEGGRTCAAAARDVMDAYERSGSTHVDLAAYPKPARSVIHVPDAPAA